MGSYLSAPVTTKQTDHGENEKLFFASTGMQGWRQDMEDANIANLDFEPNCHIFGVFDGHAGNEVSLFVAKHFLAHLIES
jgi:serine/threonine protein phosphatase PrpC